MYYLLIFHISIDEDELYPCGRLSLTVSRITALRYLSKGNPFFKEVDGVLRWQSEQISRKFTAHHVRSPIVMCSGLDYLGLYQKLFWYRSLELSKSWRGTTSLLVRVMHWLWKSTDWECFRMFFISQGPVILPCTAIRKKIDWECDEQRGVVYIWNHQQISLRLQMLHSDCTSEFIEAFALRKLWQARCHTVR